MGQGIGPVVRQDWNDDMQRIDTRQLRCRTFFGNSKHLDAAINAWLDKHKNVEVVSCQLAGGGDGASEPWTEALVWYYEVS